MKTRNARNFILGTISQLSADFNILGIHLVEGNTRIAEREQFARRCYKLMMQGVCHPQYRTKDFGFEFDAPGHYYPELLNLRTKLTVAYESNLDIFTTEKIKKMFIERFGILRKGATEYRLFHPKWDVIIYELSSDVEKIQKYNEYLRLCDRLISTLLNNEVYTIYFCICYPDREYNEQETRERAREFFTDKYKIRFQNRYNLSFYLYLNEDVILWKHLKELITQANLPNVILETVTY